MAVSFIHDGQTLARARSVAVMFYGAVATAVVLGVSREAIASESVEFVPHRAAYDISLRHAVPGSGVSELTGRMVYELSGGACKGYTQKMRFVTRIAEPDGGEQLNDLRTSSWESSEGERLRFSLDQYHNEQLAEATEGDADRKGKGRAPVSVRLSKPARKDLTLTSGVVFPMQHSRSLIRAAKDGKNVFSARLYDGSEKGERVYFTNAVIGDLSPSAEARASLPEAVSSKLKGANAWPIAISYFNEETPRGDVVPDYELSFVFFENGVSTRLMIDYGDFAIRGRLVDLTMLKPANCAAR